MKIGLIDMKLKIYKENNEFVLERINSFNHSTKRTFLTEQGLFEGLEAYQNQLEQYEIEVSDDLWSKVINHLNHLA